MGASIPTSLLTAASTGRPPCNHRLLRKARLDPVRPTKLLEIRDYLQAEGVDLLGVTDHGAFDSIHFFDPNGHRGELACPDPDEPAMLARMDAVKWQMLDEWAQTKRAPKQVAFLHAREFAA